MINRAFLDPHFSATKNGNQETAQKTPAPHPCKRYIYSQRIKPVGTGRSTPAQTRATFQPCVVRRRNTQFLKSLLGKQTERTLCIVGSLKIYQPSYYIILNINIFT
jgi:hypothetical protein